MLASATFANETASGWQQVNLATPVAITANTTYIVSYHTNGFYSASSNYFTAPVTNGSLDRSAADGVYTYGTAVSFPTSTFNAANYWVDVVFAATPRRARYYQRIDRQRYGRHTVQLHDHSDQ